MLIFAMLISLVTEAFESALRHLRHGSIPVVEGNHTVILGWTVTTPHVIDELCVAAESSGGEYIVLLTPFPKPEIEQKLQEAEIDLRNSTVVVRSGQAHFKEDLIRVAVETAKRVLVLADHRLSHEAADAQSLNVLLTLNRVLAAAHDVPADTADTADTEPSEQPSIGPSPSGKLTAASAAAAYVVAECCLVRNIKLFKSLAYGRMEVLCTQDFVSQLVVESCRQRGMSHVIAEMIGFRGSELYVAKVDGLEGRCFSELQRLLPFVVPLGYSDASGNLVVAPSLSYTFAGGEQLIMLAEDKSTLPTAVQRPCDASNQSKNLQTVKPIGTPVPLPEVRCELVVMIGWNDSVGSMMPELDQLVGPGSEVIIYSPWPIAEREKFLHSSQVRRQCFYKHLKVTHREGVLGARYQLEELPLERASKVFIMADSAETSAEKADAHTVAAILQVRDILLERSNIEHLSDVVIVPQVLGEMAVDACIFSELSDYIHSTKLSASVLASILEVPDLAPVLRDLVKSRRYTGASLYIRRIRDYARPDSLPEERRSRSTSGSWQNLLHLQARS
ncbi:unnamed protein product [Prorocentrum cordatum]|uniref:Uncharacterized protein n=1 Tax=Prorocentrum cordatum TaxID=2364126 RepID=A0ABN9R1B4_9DINO|nr:unnamed protein product [Polarella glacialis]